MARARCCRAKSSPTTTSSISTRRWAGLGVRAAGGGDHQAHQPVRRRRERRRGAAAYRWRASAIRCRAFGGIVACNRVVDDDLGRELSETFLECVIAPGFTDGARAALAKKKSLRLLAYQTPRRTGARLAAARGQRRAAGADARRSIVSAAEAEGGVEARAVGGRAARARFCVAGVQARQVERHRVRRSQDGGVRTVGVGAGQMSRVDSVKIAR